VSKGELEALGPPDSPARATGQRTGLGALIVLLVALIAGLAVTDVVAEEPAPPQDVVAFQKDGLAWCGSVDSTDSGLIVAKYLVSPAVVVPVDGCEGTQVAEALVQGSIRFYCLTYSGTADEVSVLKPGLSSGKLVQAWAVKSCKRPVSIASPVSP
jgi:hypothetical protein